MTSNDTNVDILIIGGGIVGLSILHALQSSSSHPSPQSPSSPSPYQCLLIERTSSLLNGASGRNSGILCTGVDAKPGTLERSCIRDSLTRLPQFLVEMNIPHRPCGSLVCTFDRNEESTESLEALTEIVKESQKLGDAVRTVGTGELHEMEPNLSLDVKGGLHIGGEIVVDPWLVGVALASSAREMGGVIETGWEYCAEETVLDTQEGVKGGGVWRAVCRSTGTGDGDGEGCVRQIRARMIVNATGIHADTHQAHTPDAPNPPFESRPRRGQYRIYAPPPSPSTSTPACTLPTTANPYLTHPIQPVPTQHSKGVFVFGTLYNQIVVGPTALDQDSRVDDALDPKVAEELDARLHRVLPRTTTTVPTTDPTTTTRTKDELHRLTLVGEYVGIRPGTNHRDYQIHCSPNSRWITVGGIRSTGLSASLGIGHHVRDIVHTSLKELLNTPSGQDSDPPQSTNAHASIPTPTSKPTPTPTPTPLPSIESMIQEFQESSDGSVTIHGYRYTVTHPITKCGWTHTQL